MKKIMPILVVGILVLSGLGAVALSTERSETFETIEKTEMITFSEQPVLQVEDEYLRVRFEGANSWLMEPGKPELPIHIMTIEAPKDAKNIQVVCTPKEIYTMDISGKIIPAKTFYRSSYNVDTALEEDEAVYELAEMYPSSWYSSSVTVGSNGIEIVSKIKVICSVVRYSPAESRLEYVDGFDITVTYDDTGTTGIIADEYDLVVIGPQAFSSILQKLITHKNNHGVSTTFKSVEDILSDPDYDSGRDAPEKIKLFLKYALEEWGITHVLLAGGLNSYLDADDKDNISHGTTDWHVPVRYTRIKQGSEVGCISDLYYGDIYKQGGLFEDWDSSGDGIFAAWGTFGIPDDVLDLDPDIFVSRLPCRSKIELRMIVNRIINYEKTSPDAKPWFKKFVAIAGKTFDMYGGMPDGEYVCEQSIEYMGDLIDDVVRVYASNRNTSDPVPVPKDITREMRRGSGYVNFEGHGNPIAWNTHWETGTGWAGGVLLYDFWKLFNGRKRPIVVIGGCHNALFNVSLKKTMNKDLPQHWYWTYGQPAPVCFSWGLCMIPYGGAIASTGCTGYGMGYQGMPISLSAEMEVNFFYKIGQDGATTLAQAHSGAISKFIAENDIGAVEAHCITVFQLFGDPSLELGGYE